MDKFVLLTAVAALALVPTIAAADGRGFVSVSAGQANYNSDKGYEPDASVHRHDSNAFSGSVTSGFRWTVGDAFSIGPEVGYAFLGDGKYHSTTQFTGGTDTDKGKVNTQAALVGVNALWDLGNNWNFGLRTGFLHSWNKAKEEGSVSAGLLHYSGGSRDSSNDNGFYGALSVGYDITTDLGVSVGYVHYHNDYKLDDKSFGRSTNVWSVSAEYRF